MVETHTDHYESPELAKTKAREALVPKERARVPDSRPLMRRGSRVILPALALALAMGAFSYPLFTKTEVSFTLSNDQVTESDGQVLTTRPRFTGVDKKDRLFVVNAEQGEQEDPTAKRVRLKNIDASIDLSDDDTLLMSARSGLYRIEEEQLSLTGEVMLRSDQGMTLSMGGVEIDLKAKTAKGEGAVNGSNKLGKIWSDQVSVNLAEKTGSFTGNVKLRITPAKSPDAATKDAANPSNKDTSGKLSP